MLAGPGGPAKLGRPHAATCWGVASLFIAHRVMHLPWSPSTPLWESAPSYIPVDKHHVLHSGSTTSLAATGGMNGRLLMIPSGKSRGGIGTAGCGLSRQVVGSALRQLLACGVDPEMITIVTQESDGGLGFDRRVAQFSALARPVSRSSGFTKRHKFNYKKIIYISLASWLVVRVGPAEADLGQIIAGWLVRRPESIVYRAPRARYQASAARGLRRRILAWVPHAAGR